MSTLEVYSRTDPLTTKNMSMPRCASFPPSLYRKSPVIVCSCDDTHTGPITAVRMVNGNVLGIFIPGASEDGEDGVEGIHV